MNAIDLETPSVYVDLDVLERNLARMQELCRSFGVGLRPHTKTHKIPEIARMQLDAGAVGITVAKLGEAEVLPGDDVLVAYLVMPDRLPRLRALARDRRVTVLVDSIETARALGDAETLVEVDVGLGRTGVRSVEECVAVARACGRFRGLCYYPGWADDAGFTRAARLVDDCLAALQRAGLPAEIVSGGSTPGAKRTPMVPHTTEIRPGTYVFNDASCVANGIAPIEDCALRVLCTVISTSVPGQCILDGGSKTFSGDATVNKGTYSLFPERPSWTMAKMNEEHGYVTIGDRAQVGEKVWAIPSHVCTTVNMHDEIHYGRAGRVDGTWRVAARGKIR